MKRGDYGEEVYSCGNNELIAVVTDENVDNSYNEYVVRFYRPENPDFSIAYVDKLYTLKEGKAIAQLRVFGNLLVNNDIGMRFRF